MKTLHRLMYPLQLPYQIAQIQRFWLTTAAVNFNLVATAYMESLKLSGVK